MEEREREEREERRKGECRQGEVSLDVRAQLPLACWQGEQGMQRDQSGKDHDMISVKMATIVL